MSFEGRSGAAEVDNPDETVVNRITVNTVFESVRRPLDRRSFGAVGRVEFRNISNMSVRVELVFEVYRTTDRRIDIARLDIDVMLTVRRNAVTVCRAALLDNIADRTCDNLIVSAIRRTVGRVLSAIVRIEKYAAAIRTGFISSAVYIAMFQ